jgi:RND superfamily putative drug exporter
MHAWAEFVLRHRKWVMVFWVVVMVAGGMVAGKTSERLTVDFSLPGQPGTEASNKINHALHNGGNTTPMLATVTMPAGQSITGNEDAVAATFEAVGAGVPNVRVVDEAYIGE